jgi:carbon storage regulator
VLQRAVEWGRVPTNAVKITRKPPKPHRPAVQAIPTLIEVMRARLLEQDKLRDATLLALLAYAGLRPQEALALEWPESSWGWSALVPDGRCSATDRGGPCDGPRVKCVSLAGVSPNRDASRGPSSIPRVSTSHKRPAPSSGRRRDEARSSHARARSGDRRQGGARRGPDAFPAPRGTFGIGAQARAQPRHGDQLMLVLTRKPRESVMIADEIEISVLSITHEKVRLGIEAPRDIPVFRKEVYIAIQQERRATGASARAEVDEALKRLTQR